MYDINWKIGGVGGMGAMGVGALFSKSMFRDGFFVVDYNEYNSIIKGGHNSLQVRFSTEKVFSISKEINLLLALDEYTFHLSKELKKEGSYVICDYAFIKNKNDVDVANIIDVPFSMINKEKGGDEIMKNIIGLGASLALINSRLDTAKELINDQFGRKGDDVVKKNIDLLEAGYNFVREKYSEQIKNFLQINGNYLPQNKQEKYHMTGNEAIAISAIASGMGYYAAYPMTPASSILHTLAPLASKYNLVVKHAEDEIAVINSAIGASFGGARAMVGTSGGGFALMTEGLGLSAMTETPIVCVVVSRPGPSTGMPTWTDQGDLRFVLHASQGEFLRILFAPGDLEEAYELTKIAFELSEKYHVPAIILSDKYLSEGHWSTNVDEAYMESSRNGFISQNSLDRIENYERYSDTPSGVTPRSIPGMKKGIHLANSDEHNFYGLTDESSEMRIIQLNKRYNKKLVRLQQELPNQKIYGDPASRLGVITFGSAKLPVLDALKNFKNIKLLNLNVISPFPQKEVEDFINSVEKFIVIENNYTSQLMYLIREKTGKMANDFMVKDDGRPLFFEEIIEFLKSHGY